MPNASRDCRRQTEADARADAGTRADEAAWAGRRVLVVGLGRWGGGVGVTRWLVEQGARVTVTDQASPADLTESVAALADLDVALHLGAHDPADLDATDLVVLNPAVNKLTSDFFGRVQERGCSWTTEINLFCQRCPAPIVAVTGTYGKSTTCALLATALRAGVAARELRYRTVYLGGNLGGSLLPELKHMTADEVVVLELSSAQLEDLPQVAWEPALAAITNIAPQHLDRYGSFEGYVEAKLNLVRALPKGGQVVAGELPGRVREMLLAALDGAAERLVEVESVAPALELKVPGTHNQANAACVLTMCRLLGVRAETARAALASFPGLPHRLQCVRTCDGVAYYNDSKATTPEAARRGLEVFTQPVVALVGGQDKGVDLEAWALALVTRCRGVICAGESGPRVAAALDRAGAAERGVEVRQAEDLDAAVLQAQALARAGDVVLFSPGAPSFDAYPNFEHRGRHFIDIVSSLELES